MAPTTADRLKARWSKQGGGPELEARLKAAKEELARREKLAMAKARGVKLPEKLHRPVLDPTTAATVVGVSSDSAVATAAQANAADAVSSGGGDAAMSSGERGMKTTVDAGDDAPATTAKPATADASSSSSTAAAPPERSDPPSSWSNQQQQQQQQQQQRPISVEAVMEEARAAAAKEIMAAIANGDPLPSTHPDAAQEEEDAEEAEELAALEAGCVEVYKKPQVVPPPQRLDPDDPVVRLKEEGNAALKAGEYDLANAIYTEALTTPSVDSSSKKTSSTTTSSSATSSLSPTTTTPARRLLSELVGVLYSNRARVRMLLDEPDLQGAAADAHSACVACPDWPKPRHRLAEAQLALGCYSLAMKACREGERLAVKADDHSRPFDNLMDVVAMRAAREGSLAGFDGRVIYVRSAGEEAWLGKEAPENPAFDDLENDAGFDHSPRDHGGSSSSSSSSSSSKKSRAPLHARSLAHAVQMARDGDRILVLRGIHNGLGHSCKIERRVLIRGEGRLREATVDSRANVPLFRVVRPCVIQNLDLDFTGFCECVRVEGDHRVDPLIEGCAVKCSGEDAVLVAGRSRPTFRNCDVGGKRAGLQSMQESCPEIVDCVFKTSGMQGVRATDTSAPVLRNCHLENNAHEGVVAMGRATATLVDCVVRDNKGPGVDVSDRARLVMERCKIGCNVGGVWLWDEASCDVIASDVSGGASHAVLCDVNTSPRFGGNGTRIEGVIEASDECRMMITAPPVTVIHPAVPTRLPPIEGCFKFEYDMFTRKQ